MTDPAPVVLLVDDNPTNLQVLYETLDGRGYSILVAGNGETALTVTRKSQPALILLDIMMPDMDGYEVCRRLKADPATAHIAIIFLSALDDSADKVRGLELGAVDYVSKPFDDTEVIARVETQLTISRLQQELRERNARLEQDLLVSGHILEETQQRLEGPLLGDSAVIRALRDSIAQEAGLDEPVLLIGPPGAMPDSVALAIHHASPRRERAYIHVDCALPTARPLDKIALADGGTLFLDRVHALSAEQQAELAGTLGHMAKLRRDGVEPLSDVHIVAFALKDLTDPELREAFAGHRLALPSLRDRREDISVLARHYLEQHTRRMGKSIEGISEHSDTLLRLHDWPGGVVELRNVIERAVVVSDSPVLEIDETHLQAGLPLDRYRLTKRIGAGGMGEVWLAEHQLLSRPVAVKLIRPELEDPADRRVAMQRFEREARATSQLRSPHTIQLFDFGVGEEEGSFYYVMEHLEGCDVHTLVEQFGAIEPARVAHLLAGACLSLGEAHEAGLIHRDIKPANLFVCKLGLEHDFLKVLDFGIVKEKLGDGDAELTGNFLLGTPSFISPENASGEEYDHRSDLYSLGCVAYFMLTGHSVFPTTNPLQLLQAHIMKDPVPPSKVSKTRIPRKLEALVLACLAKSPADRPQTAAELLKLLDGTGLASSWTQDRARDWWQQNASSLQ